MQVQGQTGLNSEVLSKEGENEEKGGNGKKYSAIAAMTHHIIDWLSPAGGSLSIRLATKRGVLSPTGLVGSEYRWTSYV